MTDDGAARGIARPVVTGRRRRVAARQTAEGVRARQDVVLVRRIATAVDREPLFIQGEFLVDRVPIPLIVTVQVRDVPGDDGTLGVVPRSAPDPVARVHRTLVRRGAGWERAEVGPPRLCAAAGGLRQRLAMGVRSLKSAQVRAIPLAHAGYEKAHGLDGLLRLLSRQTTRLCCSFSAGKQGGHYKEVGPLH